MPSDESFAIPLLGLAPVIRCKMTIFPECVLTKKKNKNLFLIFIGINRSNTEDSCCFIWWVGTVGFFAKILIKKEIYQDSFQENILDSTGTLERLVCKNF